MPGWPSSQFKAVNGGLLACPVGRSANPRSGWMSLSNHPWRGGYGSCLPSRVSALLCSSWSVLRWLVLGSVVCQVSCLVCTPVGVYVLSRVYLSWVCLISPPVGGWVQVVCRQVCFSFSVFYTPASNKGRDPIDAFSLASIVPIQSLMQLFPSGSGCNFPSQLAQLVCEACFPERIRGTICGQPRAQMAR